MAVKPPACEQMKVEPLALSAQQIVELQIVPTSLRAWRRADSAGKIPAPIRFGGRKLWRTSDLKLWVELGMPDRETFEKIRGQLGP